MAHALVTGANRGIGLAVVRGLLTAGHQVTALVRTRETAEALLAGERAGPSLQTVVAPLDDLDAVRAAGPALLGRPRYDVVVHNAGWWPARKVLTASGFEQAFVVNHLAPFLLNHLLVGHLGALARVINVSAGLAAVGRVDLARTPRGEDFSPLRTYATTKAFQLALTARWAEFFMPSGAVFMALHPGVFRTGLGDRPGLFGAVLKVLKRPQRPPEAGAANVLRLALDPSFAGVTGVYFDETRRIELPRPLRDPALADAIWVQALDLCGLSGAAS